jgi:hypothetical protein
MKPCALSVATMGLVLACALSHAQTPTYDSSTKYLTLPTISADGLTYNNVVVRLDSVAVISPGTPGTSGTSGTSGTGAPAAAICTVNFTTYNSISLGMTRAQVNQIVGCANDPGYTLVDPNFTALVWKDSNRLLLVYFDNATGNIVTSPTADNSPSSYKRAIGL